MRLDYVATATAAGLDRLLRLARVEKEDDSPDYNLGQDEDEDEDEELEKEVSMLLCNSDSDEEEADEGGGGRGDGRGEAAGTVDDARGGSPAGSTEIHDFLHHLNDLQRYYKIEAEKLNEERAQHADDLVLLERARRALEEVTRVQVNVCYHEAAMRKEMQDVQDENEAAERDVCILLRATRTLSCSLDADKAKLHNETTIHTREEERMRQLNRSTELYFNEKPLRTQLLSQEAELASLHDRLRDLEEAKRAGELRRDSVEASLGALRAQIAEQSLANAELAKKIGETTSTRAAVLSQLNDMRLRHASTKTKLKEDLNSTMRELSDASVECHTAESQVTSRNRVVNELSKRLDSLTKEAEAKAASRHKALSTSGPTTKRPFGRT